MILQSIRLRNFRAHDDTRVRFEDQINTIVGPNGVGKTNVLEAVHYACLAKSFLGARDSITLRRGTDHFMIDAEFDRDGSATTTRVVYSREEGKRILVNGARLESVAKLVGRFPVVVFSPEDHGLTAGGPEERRRFLDNALCQAQPRYLADLLRYRRVLRQRNKLLAQRPTLPDAQIDPWTSELVAAGARIIHARDAFVKQFEVHLIQAYDLLESVHEAPSMTYRTSVQDSGEDPQSIGVQLLTRFAEAASNERRRGRTLFGPHRDEVVFDLDEFHVRHYASQGQHRTFGMALKLAQSYFLQAALGRHPLLLLDDVFDNLDPDRTASFMRLLTSDAVGQSIITAADDRHFTAAHNCQKLIRRESAVELEPC